MNIALPALLIFLFILPGFIFNLTFYRTENAPLNFIPLTHKAIVSSIVTLLLHSCWLLIIYLLSYQINFELILVLISGLQNESFSSSINSITPNNLFYFCIYLFSMYVSAYCIGSSFRWCIKHFKLDKRSSIFRIDSPWYYLFKGYDWKEGTPDGVQIVATVEIAKKGYLYLGWLDKFYLNNSGDIDRLVLTSAMRRLIKNDKKSPEDNSLLERFYPIDGDYFVIPYKEIKSLNVQYVKIEEIYTT